MGAPTIATNAATTTRNADSRKRRELIVTIRDKDQESVTAKRSPEAILEVLRSMEPRKATDKIVTLRRLPSKDLQLVMADEESRKELETSHEWLQAIAESAEMKKPLYTVWVHGVRVQGVPTSNQSQAIETIRKANERLHPGLQIARLSWKKKDLERAYGSLILDTTDYRAANNLIQKGLVHDGEIKTCVRFVRAARVTQCVRCNRYGHVASHCTYSQACGICAGDHSSSQCKIDREKERNRQKCVVCGERHPAWSRDCKIRQQHIYRAKLALQTTPIYYEESREHTVGEESRPTFHFDTQDSEGFTPVARKGRPSFLTKAGQAANQTRIFVGRKRPRPDSNPDTITGNHFSQIPSSLPSQGYFQVLGTQEQAADEIMQEVTSENEATQPPTSQANAE